MDNVGREWIIQEIDELTDHIEHVKPSEYNEETRYLPESVTSMPGYLRYAVNPFMREIVDCFDVDSPVRELALMKGVQITYTTALESGLLYFMGHVRTLPIMYITADKELAAARVENNIIPMLNQSGLAHIIRSSDEGNSRKTGKTKDHLQFEGGGYLVPFGARNADKMRSYSICIMLKDEIDAWPATVGKDGCPDALSDARCTGYWPRRKIFKGSTPLIKGSSKIHKAYLRGDQRKYHVLCKACSFPQHLRWQTRNKETGVRGGFQWDLGEHGELLLESVCWCCKNCGEEHYELDKERLFSEDHGAEWVPTSHAAEPDIRSYHLPALYSPIGMQPWYKCVGDYLKGFDPKTRKVIDIPAYQVFYNNILAEPFEIMGSKVSFVSVSAHRRMGYKKGEIPNKHAVKFSGSRILFLTCLVDVHDQNLAVSVLGWARESRCYVIDYWRFERDSDVPCTDISSRVWGRLRDLIEDKEYTADDGYRYKVALTLVDASYENATVVSFCSDYDSYVYPILGRDRPAKNSAIKEFSEFTTQAGTTGYKVVVDHYKDRMAPVLRREWVEGAGEQKPYHFNAPVDITTKELKELTVESRREKLDDRGVKSHYWYRPGNARNELWDLLGYGYFSVELLAWILWIEHFEEEAIDWHKFWDYIEKENLYCSPPERNN